MENPQKFCRKFKDVSLEELRDKVAEFAKVRNWDQYHSPRNLHLALVGEVGELSEMFQWKGEVERGLPNWSSEDKKHLEEEISDVLLYLVQLADVCGLDLGQAALSKILKNAQKYPLVNNFGLILWVSSFKMLVPFLVIKWDPQNRESGKRVEKNNIVYVLVSFCVQVLCFR